MTGVSQGLGSALVAKLIELGHTVHGCCRSVEAIKALSARHGEPHSFSKVDVTSDEEVGAWAAGLPSPDLVLNVAGLSVPPAPFWEVPSEHFRAIMEVNVLGVANVCRHLVRRLVDSGHGIVVNFSSYWGRSASPEMAPYCASKWAVEGLTQCLARELSFVPGTAALTLNPGVINTATTLNALGPEAASEFPDAAKWAADAAPFLLGLTADLNGACLTLAGY
eukprot:CAMPEP_0177641272 /NCGR_PEP_ID=MMETSP0447-20121125/6977_1 /TAXON_ID=0 /ORGANISM="Stygamoeba regulata, Strain BSH-02190019" /LENGTH=221 /DNA_ID=CAMNT_0019143377 /DNA_START=141 /DNA_END=806 /DNA_ORIENTATION=-